MIPASSVNQLHLKTESGLSRQIENFWADWAADGCEVILLDAECPEGLALKSRLQSFGLQVLIGPYAHAEEALPLIVLHALNRRKPEMQFRLRAARELFPDALVCFVTGSMAQTFTSSNFNDARLALSAAGVGFVCDETGTGLARPDPSRGKKFLQ